MEHAAGAPPPICESKWVISCLRYVSSGNFLKRHERFASAFVFFKAFPVVSISISEHQLHPSHGVAAEETLREAIGPYLPRREVDAERSYKWFTRDGNTVNPSIHCLLFCFLRFFLHMVFKDFSYSIYTNYKHIGLAYTFLAHFDLPKNSLRWRYEPSSLTEVLQILVVCLDFHGGNWWRSRIDS